MVAGWPPEISLRHDVLDREHRELSRLLVVAVSAIETGTAVEARATFAAFSDAMLAHTAHEDELMEASVYPDRGRHRAAHATFLADLHQLQAELAEKGPTPAVGEWLRVRVVEWLRFHVAVNDLKLAEHLAKVGTPASRPGRRASRPAS